MDGLRRNAMLFVDVAAAIVAYVDDDEVECVSVGVIAAMAMPVADNVGFLLR